MNRKKEPTGPFFASTNHVLVTYTSNVGGKVANHRGLRPSDLIVVLSKKFASLIVRALLIRRREVLEVVKQQMLRRFAGDI